MIQSRKAYFIFLSHGLLHGKTFDMRSCFLRHSLPESLHDVSRTRTDEEYEKLFSSGYPIIVYYHGNAGTR